MPSTADQFTASLATRHRPRDFSTVVGQVHVVEVLRRAVMANTVPQQILFSGGSGLGKTTIARIVAAAMLCETALADRTRGDACGTCPSCCDVTTSSHPDLIEFDAASHGGKDEIREIAARCQVMPLRGSVKIYVIDEAHGLSNPGGQAFLKLLEEPPAHVRFMLCTTDPDRMLKTNRGRCVEFELLPPSRHELLTNLSRICKLETWNAPTAVLESVLDAADPELGVRGTITTLAKLGTVLADGAAVSPEMIASLLGTPSPVVLRRLVEGIASRDRVKALEALEQARRSAPDAVLREALLTWARREVAAALAAKGNGLEAALWQLEVLLESRPGAAWLDVTIAKLAAPSLDGPRGVDRLTAEAAELLTALEGKLAAPTSTPSKEPSVPSAPSAPSAPSSGVAQLLAAASPSTPEMRSLLPRCQVTISSAEVEVVAPDELVEVLKPLVPALRTAAGRLGLPLKLRKSSTAGAPPR